MTSQANNQIVVDRVARNVARARADAGKYWTQRKVAIALDLDMRAVQRWEQGIAIPSVTNLVRLAELFDLDPGWFYTDHDQVTA